MANDRETGTRSTILEAPTDVNDINPSHGTGQTPLRGKTGAETLGTGHTLDSSNPPLPHVSRGAAETTETARQTGLAAGAAPARVDTKTNPDPLTGEMGSHPVGTGVGAVGGAATGAAIGGAVGGPAGALLGAAIGGVAGGFAGKGIAEAVNPTDEDAYWRSTYSTRPYAAGRTYEELRPAYEYGWTSRATYHDRGWDEAQNDLEHGWEKAKAQTRLGWGEAKGAVQDAWNRVDSRVRGQGVNDRGERGDR